jgi:hypothetical protein
VLLLAAAAALLAAAAASPPPPLSAPAPSRPFPQVLEVVEVIASLKGVDVAQVAEATYQNTLRVLFDSGSWHGDLEIYIWRSQDDFHPSWQACHH